MLMGIFLKSFSERHVACAPVSYNHGKFSVPDTDFKLIIGLDFEVSMSFINSFSIAFLAHNALIRSTVKSSKIKGLISSSWLFVGFPAGAVVEPFSSFLEYKLKTHYPLLFSEQNEVLGNNLHCRVLLQCLPGG